MALQLKVVLLKSHIRMYSTELETELVVAIRCKVQAIGTAGARCTGASAFQFKQPKYRLSQIYYDLDPSQIFFVDE